MVGTIGAQIGKYVLERRLGAGGMGEVWAAHDPDLDRKVALKVLHARVAAADDAQRRFQREGRAMARLRHPNVIVVYDATFSEGRGVIAMELVDGENLATWATRPHAPAEIVRVIVAAGRGLAAAHAAGLIHRDFKPHNVLISRDGRVLVTDFGLARAIEAPAATSSPAGATLASAAAAEPDPLANPPGDATDPLAATAARNATPDPLAATAARNATPGPLAATAARNATPGPLAVTAARGDATDPLAATAARNAATGPLAATAARNATPGPLAETAARGDTSTPLAETSAPGDATDPLAETAAPGDATDPLAETAARNATPGPLAETAARGDATDPLAATAARNATPGPLAATAARNATPDPLAATAAPGDATDPLAETAARGDTSTPLAETSAPGDATDPLAETAARGDTSAPLAETPAPAPTPADGETVASTSPARTAPRDELATPLTETGALLGTPAYMAPEQLAGDAADERSDVFAFCVTAWELLAGERPFRGKTLVELQRAIEDGAPAAIQRVPARLRGLLARGLAADPRARWPTIEALLAAIERAWRRPRRIAMGAAALLALGGAAAVVAVVPGGEPRAADPCADHAGALATAWSPAIRADLARLLDGKPYRDRTLRFFDGWSDAWQAARAGNCKLPDDADFAPRAACLDAIRDEVALIMQRRASLPVEMWTAPDLPHIVPAPVACVNDPRGLAPPPPPAGVRDEVARVRAELATARVPIIMRSPSLGALDLAPLLARARATDYRPVIAEAMVLDALVRYMRARPAERPQLCEAFTAAANEAEAIGYERMVVSALELRYQCLEPVRDRDEEAGQLLARLQRITARTRNPVQVFWVNVASARRDARDGRLERALQSTIDACRIADELGLPNEQADCRTEQAKVLFARHRPGDHDRAIALLDEAEERGVAKLDGAIRQLRARIAWQRGRAIEPPRELAALARPKAPVELRIRVLGSAGAIAGAEVGIASWLYADSHRVVMLEHLALARVATSDGAMVRGTTDARGELVVQAPERSLVFVRAGGESGVAAAPDAGGTVVVRLAPSAAVAGTTTGVHDVSHDGTADLAYRAATRLPGTVLLVRELAGRRLIFAAPIDERGTWRATGIPPGRYLVAAQTITGLGGVLAAQRWIDLRAGETTAPGLALPAQPSILEVLARGETAVILAFAGTATPPPTTLAAMQRHTEHATWLSAARPMRTSPSDRGTFPGSVIARLPIGDGPAMVCALPDAAITRDTPLGWPLARPAAPRCVRVEAGASRVVID